jgi:serine/threonine protein kinase
VKLAETFADPVNLNSIFEYLPGQDLHWVLNNEHNLKLSKKSGATTRNPRKKWVTFYVSELLMALRFLHKRNIIYRDLKPDNVMIDMEGHIKLIDFGFSKQFKNGCMRTKTNCGTHGYTAPEVLTNGSSHCNGYSLEADIWSLGIMLSELLCG